MEKSRAFGGGRKQFSDVEMPKDTDEVLSVVQRFIRERFAFPEIAEEISEDLSAYGRFACTMADDTDESNVLFTADGELVAYGSFMYLAKNDSVQTIWENKFEVREQGSEIVVNVSDWFGPTPNSWRETYQELQREK